jgi:hypothetical protein
MAYRPRYQPSDVAIEALTRRYAAWAASRGLAVAPGSAHRYSGRLRAWEVDFATGLGGSRPSPPEIVVFVALDIDVPVLLRRVPQDDEPELLVALREVLATGADVRNIGVTSRLVRITFEPGTEAELFELAFDALDERLRVVTTNHAPPYRG